MEKLFINIENCFWPSGTWRKARNLVQYLQLKIYNKTTDIDKIVKIRSYERFIGGKKNDQDQRLKLIQSTELKSLSVSGIPQENWILTFLYDILSSPWLVLASSSSMTGAREELACTDINMSTGRTEEQRDVQDGNQCDITLWPI